MKLKTMEMSDATASLADYVCALSEQPLVVTRDGAPVAVLLPVEDTDLETVSLSLDPAFNAMLQRSRLRHAREGGIPLDEMLRRFGLENDEPAEATAPPAKVGTPPKPRRRNS